MKNYYAFLKKEAMESNRTYKTLILFCVFFFFGMLSPVTAKVMPKILSEFMPSGMKITLATPVILDAWAQFYKNVSQMGLFLLVILFSGVLATEKTKGTLVIMVTKGLSRNTILFAKFTMMIVLWTTSLAAAALTTYGYSCYLFPGETLPHLFFSLVALWVYGVFLFALLLFMATFTKSNYSALLLTGGLVAILMMLNLFPTIKKISPLFLSSNNVALLGNTVTVKSFILPMGITAGCTILFVLGASLLFRKQQI